MNSPLQVVGLLPATSSREEPSRANPRTDIQWGTPIFRAPALPTPYQIHRELPFTTDLRPSRLRPRS
jgi:hypothetical protein